MFLGKSGQLHMPEHTHRDSSRLIKTDVSNTSNRSTCTYMIQSGTQAQVH